MQTNGPTCASDATSADGSTTALGWMPAARAGTDSNRPEIRAKAT